jgi:chemotaxis protein histidine kinase CheA
MAQKLDTLRSLLDWRQPGGLVSVTGHAAMLIVGLAAFSSAKPFMPAQEGVAVDVISEREFNEMMKGDKKGEKRPEPQARAESVAETRRNNEPGTAKKDVAAEPARAEPPKAEAKPEPQRQVAALPPPPVRPPELKPVMRPPEPKPEEPPDEKAEIPTPPKRPDPRPEPKKEELAKLLEQKQLEDKRREEAKAAEEKRQAEENQKAEEKKRADERAAAERKTREDREKREREAAEAKRLEDAIRQRLLTSREAPSSTGATAAQVSREASLGAENATGRRLTPSERSQLIGHLTEQMNRCLSIPPGAIPRSKPIVALTLGRDGSITSGPTLTNPMNEPGYMPYAEANMRALRNCAPFKIPERFMATYEDWKSLRIGFDPSEMQ